MLTMHITFSFDTLIALVALLLSIASAIYAWHFNLFRMSITNIDVHEEREHVMISFSVSNISTRALTIEGITLERDGHQILDNGFNPEEYDIEKNRQNRQSWDESHPVYTDGPLPVPQMRWNPYDLSPAYDPSSVSSPFKRSVELVPFHAEEFSYYVDALPQTINVTCNHRIHRLSKTISIPTKLD